MTFETSIHKRGPAFSKLILINPNCRRIFTRELIKKDKVGILPTAVTSKERRFYRCKHCGHEWETDVYID